MMSAQGQGINAATSHSITAETISTIVVALFAPFVPIIPSVASVWLILRLRRKASAGRAKILLLVNAIVIVVNIVLTVMAFATGALLLTD